MLHVPRLLLRHARRAARRPLPLRLAALQGLGAALSREFALHASILSQMELLSARYEELSAELSHNDGSMAAERITSLSIEMADMEPKVLASRELRSKQEAIQELEEVVDGYIFETCTATLTRCNCKMLWC